MGPFPSDAKCQCCELASQLWFLPCGTLSSRYTSRNGVSLQGSAKETLKCPIWNNLDRHVMSVYLNLTHLWLGFSSTKTDPSGCEFTQNLSITKCHAHILNQTRTLLKGCAATKRLGIEYTNQRFASNCPTWGSKFVSQWCVIWCVISWKCNHASHRWLVQSDSHNVSETITQISRWNGVLNESVSLICYHCISCIKPLNAIVGPWLHTYQHNLMFQMANSLTVLHIHNVVKYRPKYTFQASKSMAKCCTCHAQYLRLP